MDKQIFHNTQIEPRSLPRIGDILFHPLPLSYRNILLITTGLFMLFLLAALVVFFGILGDEVAFPLGWALAIWLAFASFLIVRIFLTFPHKGYAIREKDIVYRKGWLWRSVTTVPFNRVQHCDIKQGLLERQFKLSSLNVYTAGGQNSDLTIPGLDFEMAERYKAFILKTISSDEEE